MTNQLENNQPQESLITSEGIHLYERQLGEVILWQLRVERTEEPLDLTGPAEPDYSWTISIAEEDDQYRTPVKLTLDYSYPKNQPPTYRVLMELIGIFVRLIPPGEENTSDPTQIPLNDFTVMTMLWPYTRELLHQVQLRMRVPVALLPTLNAVNFQALEHTEETTEQE